MNKDFLSILDLSPEELEETLADWRRRILESLPDR